MVSGMLLRPANSGDIPHIVRLEQSPHAREFVGQWPEEEHRQIMAGADARYFVVDDEHASFAGFVILRGLQTEHRAIELKRIVLKTTGRGQGRQILQSILEKAFGEYHAHKLWLDVFESNERARHLYRSLGFREDGVLRDAVYRDSQFHSLTLMSQLESEYAAARDLVISGP